MESSLQAASTAVPMATSTYSYTAGSHRLTSVNGEALSYDAMGNLIARGPASVPSGARQTYQYDENGRPRYVFEQTSTRALYLYNPLGQRVFRRAYDGLWRSAYDLEGNWIGDYDMGGVPRQQVIWFAGMPVGVIDRRRQGAAQEGARLFYVEADALGTPRAVIDPIAANHPWGKAVWRWELTGEAFGRDRPLDDPDGDGKRFTFDLRFPGQRYDDVTGLHYNYFRDYDPAVGRYVQSDPIGLEGGISTYAYVSARPMNWTDPLGLSGSTAVPYTPPTPSTIPATLRTVITVGGRVVGPATAAWAGWEVGTAINDRIEGSVGSPGTALFDLLNPEAYDAAPNCPPDEGCPPCRTISGRVVAPGTIGYRLDRVPPSRPHYPYSGDHYNLFKALQNPHNCRCQWKRLGAADASAGQSPPAGSIPIEPFAIPKN